MHMPNLRGRPSVTPLPEWAGCGAEFAVSHVAAPSAPARRGRRISLGALTSVLTLAGLIAGLGYGAHALLLDLQRVGFAPLTTAPTTFSTAPLFRAPALDRTEASEANLGANEWYGFQLAATQAGRSARDGPISGIDPAITGHFSPRLAADAQPSRASPSDFDAPDVSNGEMRITLSPDEAALVEPLLATARTAPPKVVLHATDETWIRVRDGKAVIFEGILQPGSQYEVPGRASDPLLRTGNAGALFALLDGAPYGPIGSSSVVLRSMSLRAGDIAGQVPEASHWGLSPDSGSESLRRIDAIVTR